MQETLPCPTYMDVLAILLEAESYPALHVRLATVTQGTVRIASDFGLQLDLVPGKTEAAVSWVGLGSRPIRRRLLSLSANRQVAMLPLRTRLGDDGDMQIPALAEAVRIVQACRIASRANAGQAATHALSRRLLGNESFHATCVSRWPRLVWPRGVCTRRRRGTFSRVAAVEHGANLGASLPGLIGRRPRVRDGSPTKRCRRNCRSANRRMSWRV